jgi:hypothetical protein
MIQLNYKALHTIPRIIHEKRKEKYDALPPQE